MTRIYLIRHGQAEGNLYRIAQGHEDGKLTRLGWEQVRALARRFEDIHVDAVYSSDLYRARATASAIYIPKGLPLIQDKALREAFLGDWEGRPWGQIYREEPEQLTNFSMNPGRWRAKNGETALQAQQRLEEAVRRIGRENEGRTIAIASHGYAIRMLLGKLQGYTMDNMGDSPQEDNTAVSLLELDGDSLRVIFRGDTGHLPSSAAVKAPSAHSAAVEGGMYYREPHSYEDRALIDTMVSAAISEAEMRPTAGEFLSLLAYDGEEPSALLQMGSINSICTLYVLPSQRRRGLGVQLIGQAQQRALSYAADALCISVCRTSPAIPFLKENDFVPVGETAEGLVRFEKSLGCDHFPPL